MEDEDKRTMAKFIADLYRSVTSTYFGRFILLMVLLAFFIDGFAYFKGLDDLLPAGYAPDTYGSFFEVPAWWPFPLYFILVAFVVRQSWDSFNEAWQKLPGTKVIQYRGGRELEDGDAKVAMNHIISDFEWWRKWVLIPVAFIGGAYCMYMDSERERATMLATITDIEQYTDKDIRDPYKGVQTTFSGQVARACEAPDFQSRWLWAKLAEYEIPGEDACKLALCKTQPCDDESVLQSNTRNKQYRERVDNVKMLLEEEYRADDYMPAPPCQWITEMLLHFESMILISLGWLVFLQCVAHAIFFWNFERLPSANEKDKELSLKLNCTSGLCEFGLEHWNHELNNLYWYFSGALIIPFLSRVSQHNLQDLDTSQVVLQIAIPILVATPMITTILARQNRLPACWHNKAPEFIEAYKKQRLWPLDKNWSSKLGILLAFVLLSLSFGINMTMLF